MSDWTIGGINLPHNPARARMSHTAVEEESPLPGALPLLISVGRKSDKLSIEGWLFVEGQDKAYLETNFIDTLEAKVKDEVTIAAPNSRYDGDWIFDKFDYEEGIHRGNAAFYYEMVFKKGSIQMVL